MFEIIDTPLEGLKILKTKVFEDNRGVFKKIFSADEYERLGLTTELRESYFSVNKQDVIRGMHFQVPPADHIKIVYVLSGAITDVVLDIRKNSKTYEEVYSIKLSADDGQFIYIPKGFAHGFASLEDNTIVHYLQTSCYNAECDCGISYDSIGYNWNIEHPIVSGRDLSHPKLADFKNPF
ncbi:MAG: dTDP-4-dehydrorhamnose 3,5-epimerase family protein [Treponema sp.]|nr:dTDP-4-dehydrorhamnose 3,5-epimerase family protein [Treponema sp.]